MPWTPTPYSVNCPLERGDDKNIGGIVARCEEPLISNVTQDMCRDPKCFMLRIKFAPKNSQDNVTNFHTS